MNRDRISELENKIAEAFKAGNRARKKESVQDMSGMSERYPDEPDPDADKGSQLDPEPMFNRLRDWMTKLGWGVGEGSSHYFTIKMDSGDPVLGEIEAEISTYIRYGKTRGYNLDFYLEFKFWPWEVNWYQFCANFIPGMSYRNEAFLDWNGFCRFIADLTILLRNPVFAETVRKFASNYIVAVLKRSMSNSDYILSILFQEIVRDKFGIDFVSDKFRYTLYKSMMADSHQNAYYELLDQAHAISTCINWDPDPKILEGFRQRRIADMEGDKPVNEAFKAGNRARKKESAQDAVESVDNIQAQIELFKKQTGEELEIRDGRPYYNGDLDLDHCTGLTGLPAGLEVKGCLSVDHCTGLTSLPAGLKVGGGLGLARCTGLTSLPDNLKVKKTLNLVGCTGLTGLPFDLVVQGNYIIHRGILTPFFRKLGIPVDDEGDTKASDWREWQRAHGYLSEAFKAGNRARKKESVQDTVESPDMPLQKFLKYFSENAFKTITGCGVYNYSIKVTSPESFRINCIQTTDSEGDGLPYGEVELIINLTDFAFDGKWYNLSSEMAWKDVDGTSGQNWDNEQQDFIGKEDFSVKCRSLFALAKNAWMKIGMWIEFGSNAHAEPHEWYFDEKIREVMKNDGIEMDEPVEVGEAFKAGNRARKKESVQDTVQGIDGMSIEEQIKLFEEQTGKKLKIFNGRPYYPDYYDLNLVDCINLTSLPTGFMVGEPRGNDFKLGRLKIENCPNLTSLPAGLNVSNLEIRKCDKFVSFPPGMKIGYYYENKFWYGSLTISNCPELISLPTELTVGALDIRNCPKLTAVPVDFSVESWINIDNCPGLISAPNEIYKDDRFKMMFNKSVLPLLPAELRLVPKSSQSVSEAFRAGNRARKKESVADTVESVSGDRIFKDFDDFKTVAEGLLRSTGLEMNTKIELLPDTKNWYGLTVDLNDDNKPYNTSLIFKFVNIGRGDGLLAVGDEAEKVKELPGFNEALHNGIERFDIAFHGEVSPNDLLDATGIKYRITVADDWHGYKPDPMFMPIAGWNVYNPGVPVNYAVLTYSMLKVLVDNIIVPLARGYHDSTDLKGRLDTFRLSVMSRVDRELEAPKKPEGPGSGTWRHDKDDLLKSVRRLLKKDGLFRFRAIIDSILACNGRLEKDSHQEYINPYGLNYLMPDDKKFFQDLKTEYYGLFKNRKPFDVCI